MKKMKFVWLALLVFSVVFASCEAALAKPSWLTVKYAGHELRRTKGVEDTNSGEYYTLVMKFDLINNSKNGDIMTAIYDRTINLNGTFYVGGSVDGTWNVKHGWKGTNPYEGKWYPGQVYKYEGSVPLSSILSTPKKGWKTANDAITVSGYTFKANWTFDCQVRSHK